MFPIVDKSQNVIALMSALRSYLGLPIYHSEDIDMKDILNKQKPKQIIVLLIDGMGTYQIKRDCKRTGFLNTHQLKTLQSVYPPTTAASTTSILSGKYPMETCWLGWQQYFKEVDEHLVMFLNRKYYKKEPFEIPNYPYKMLPTKQMVEECNEKNIRADVIFPAFHPQGVSSFEEMCQRIVEESNKQQNTFVYAYWDEYDDYMHQHGASSIGSKKMLVAYERLLEQTSQLLEKDTMLVILADHGHIDVTCKYLVDYPDLLAFCEKLPSIESRTLNWYIKKGMLETFKERFLTYFKNEYTLYTKQEAIDLHIFGYGQEHPRFKSFLGDFITCAIGNVNLVYDASYKVLGAHAGCTREELEIPIIVYPK
ncbi:MAG: alkaline phosphatase family protein [Longicatena sp.]